MSVLKNLKAFILSTDIFNSSKKYIHTDWLQSITLSDTGITRLSSQSSFKSVWTFSAQHMWPTRITSDENRDYKTVNLFLNISNAISPFSQLHTWFLFLIQIPSIPGNTSHKCQHVHASHLVHFTESTEDGCMCPRTHLLHICPLLFHCTLMRLFQRLRNEKVEAT